MADNVTIRVIAERSSRGGLVGGGKTVDGAAGELPPAGQTADQRKLNAEVLKDDGVGRARAATVSSSGVAQRPAMVSGVSSSRAHITNPDGSSRHDVDALKRFIVEAKAADAEKMFPTKPDFISDTAKRREKIEVDLPNPPHYRAPTANGRAPGDILSFISVGTRTANLDPEAFNAAMRRGDAQDLSFLKSNSSNFLRDQGEPLVSWRKQASESKKAVRSGSGNKKSWLNTTGYSVSNTGAGGARGGYSKFLRNLSGKGQYVKSIFSRALERTGITGMSHLATFSTFGLAVAVPQVAAYIGRELMQDEIEALQREGRIAAKNYRSMKRSEVFRDIAKRGRDLMDAEHTAFAIDKMGEFAPLIALMVMSQSKIQALPWQLKAPAVVAATVGLSALVGYAASGFAPTPGTAAWATKTVADNITPGDIRGGTLKLTAEGSVDVEVTASQGDLRYGALLSRLYSGAQSVETVGGEAVAMMARSRAITSPYDIIRMKAAVASNPKMGTGNFAGSAQAAFKAEGESTEIAERVAMMRLMRNVAKRNSVQEAQADKVFR